MKKQLNKLKSFLGFSVKSPVTRTSSTLLIGVLALLGSLLTIPSKSLGQSTNIITYCSELQSWNNNPQGTINSLGITIVTNKSDGLGRLYRGAVRSNITNFLGLPNTPFFRSTGKISTNRTSSFGSVGIADSISSFQGGFNWVCNRSPEAASINVEYPAQEVLGQVVAARREIFQVRNIRLVNNILYGQVQESDGSLSEAIITFQKYASPIIK